MWFNEYGLKGGDEINILIVGKNYGWLLVIQGVNYFGLLIFEVKGIYVDGIEQFVYYWEKLSGISGMVFYDVD